LRGARERGGTLIFGTNSGGLAFREKERHNHLVVKREKKTIHHKGSWWDCCGGTREEKKSETSTALCAGVRGTRGDAWQKRGESGRNLASGREGGYRDERSCQERPIPS